MGRHRRSEKRAGKPVRTGLLGASAAMAVGAAAVASGLLPGGDTFTVGGDSSVPGSRVTDGGAPELQTQGEASSSPTKLPSRTPPPPAHAPSKSPVPKAPAKPSAKPTERTTPPAPPRKKKTAPPVREKPRDSDRSVERKVPPKPSPSESAAEAEVLALVNQERANAGCAPVRFDASLARLAGAFSDDMANRGFFDHTDPDGDSPWDRAAQAGVKHLGGENIARGQADPGAVMNSWMNSDGHRANILNCDYKTLGVGVHMGDGGPWWTQNFGF
ncbi:CAP domain-containing protein [Streptomyces sp. NPDC055078]